MLDKRRQLQCKTQAISLSMIPILRSFGRVWQSFDSPTDTFLPGQSLLPGMEMYSSASATDHSKGRFLLIMQLDGYLVQYPALAPFTIQYGYWDSGPEVAGANATLHLDNNGKLYIRNSTGFAVKTLSAEKGNDSMYRLTVDVDGFFRLYSHAYTGNENWTVVWAPTKYDNCGPKGLCGFNAYCTLMDQEASCRRALNMEIICCRRALNMELVEDEVILVDWVSQCLYGGKLR